jgi:hypothetical protein
MQELDASQIFDFAAQRSCPEQQQGIFMLHSRTFRPSNEMNRPKAA